MRNVGVHGLLVTGPEKNLRTFHLAVCLVLNGHDRRDNTVHYSCMAEHLSMALETAQIADVSVQEISGSGESEGYRDLHIGTHKMTWRPRTEAKEPRK